MLMVRRACRLAALLALAALRGASGLHPALGVPHRAPPAGRPACCARRPPAARMEAPVTEAEAAASAAGVSEPSVVTLPIVQSGEGVEESDGVVCARGVCVLAEDDAPEVCYIDEESMSLKCEPNPEATSPSLSVEYLWPRALLLGCSVLYGTNFPLGRLMNDALPASAASSARLLIAMLALAPFLKVRVRGATPP